MPTYFNKILIELYTQGGNYEENLCKESCQQPTLLQIYCYYALNLVYVVKVDYFVPNILLYTAQKWLKELWTSISKLLMFMYR